MSYEGKMLSDLDMPSKQKVQQALLISLFNRNGTIKEFGAGEEIVEEIGATLHLNESQRKAQLETIYRKENRIKKSSLWHRLLFRAADDLAKREFVLRPSDTIALTNQKEWMLTEKGYDEALILLNMPLSSKASFIVKSYEVETVVKQLEQAKRPINYVPTEEKKIAIATMEISIRSRGFRQAVIKAYEYRCAVCGLKICSPNSKVWEVQAAHIVPHSAKGKDDILNGISLCHIHHWAFDAGWFSFNDDYTLLVANEWATLPNDFGRMESYSLFPTTKEKIKLILPSNSAMYPHISSIEWHRNNIFNRKYNV